MPLRGTKCLSDLMVYFQVHFRYNNIYTLMPPPNAELPTLTNPYIPQLHEYAEFPSYALFGSENPRVMKSPPFCA